MTWHIECDDISTDIHIAGLFEGWLIEYDGTDYSVGRAVTNATGIPVVQLWPVDQHDMVLIDNAPAFELSMWDDNRIRIY